MATGVSRASYKILADLFTCAFPWCPPDQSQGPFPCFRCIWHIEQQSYIYRPLSTVWAESSISHHPPSLPKEFFLVPTLGWGDFRAQVNYFLQISPQCIIKLLIGTGHLGSSLACSPLCCHGLLKDVWLRLHIICHLGTAKSRPIWIFHVCQWCPV